MANYYASCRSNYFKVKNKEEFERAMRMCPDVRVESDERGHVLLGNNSDGGGWPSWKYDEAGEMTGDEVDFFADVAAYLADGEVAIFMEAGHEKLRYVNGSAVAINNRLERRIVNLNDIYEAAKALTTDGHEITRAEY